MENLQESPQAFQRELPYGIDPHKLYTLDFVAEKLSVSKSLVLWWIKSGKLRGVRLPSRSWRVLGLDIILTIDKGMKDRSVRGGGAEG
ncbi:MAG: hypothetical protein QXS54_05215 [Candidatus Methanomethylicaceae archaeon]